MCAVGVWNGRAVTFLKRLLLVVIFFVMHIYVARRFAFFTQRRALCRGCYFTACSWVLFTRYINSQSRVQSCQSFV
uniref:Uncharacterized protein n=1 Tax=Anguilla anguilla TaxID=7936 RepID=A0A0E9SK11_ANGAN